MDDTTQTRPRKRDRQADDPPGLYAPFRNGMRHTAFLARLVEASRAQSYFEVGTSHGHSLANVSCASVCVDPAFRVEQNIIGNKPALHVFQMTSDDFFARYELSAFLPAPGVLDFAFLDGMHHFEFLLRDVMNTERYCGPHSVVVLHDCLPQRPLNARRRDADRKRFALETRRVVPTEGGGWTGDAWKVLRILQRNRPDLRITIFDCPPSSLVVLTGLDPQNTVLHDRYDDLIAEWMEADTVPGWFDALHDEATLTASREHATSEAIRATLELPD